MNFDEEFKDLKKFIINQVNKGAKVSIPENYDDKSGFYIPEEIEIGGNKIYEGDKLEIIDINTQAQESGFSYFIDGIERKKKIIITNKGGPIPVIYGYVSAVIMQRTNGILRSTDLFIENLSTYLPYKPVNKTGEEPNYYFDFEDINKFKRKYVNTGVIDVRGKNHDYPRYPVQIEQSAHSKIQTERGNSEKELVKKWNEKKDTKGWLFVDGRLEPVSKYVSYNSNIVGVIKSIRRYYFKPDEQLKIYTLKKRQRTSIFIPIDPEGNEENVFSWYLRLHDNNLNGNEDFGIIRVEISRKDSESVSKEEVIKKVNLISNWILLETNPVAFPASRWDRMIYPILYCEKYLDSRAPSKVRMANIAKIKNIKNN